MLAYARETVADETGIGRHRQRIRWWSALALAQAPRRVLVATDCLSEGMNLQEHFDAVLHYDLPWNPTRLEQREGRVLRGRGVSAAQLPLDLFGEERADLFARWESASERERRSRTLFAQEGIRVEEVAQELAAAQQAVGRWGWMSSGSWSRR